MSGILRKYKLYLLGANLETDSIDSFTIAELEEFISIFDGIKHHKDHYCNNKNDIVLKDYRNFIHISDIFRKFSMKEGCLELLYDIMEESGFVLNRSYMIKYVDFEIDR